MTDQHAELAAVGSVGWGIGIDSARSGHSALHCEKVSLAWVGNESGSCC
jgi:hypothetical protein